MVRIAGRSAGDPLTEVQREVGHGLEFARKAQFGTLIDVITSQLPFALVFLVPTKSPPNPQKSSAGSSDETSTSSVESLIAVRAARIKPADAVSTELINKHADLYLWNEDSASRAASSL